MAPRGFGRTSYRIAEIIQLGRIPVYMYDEDEWLPYGGMHANIYYPYYINAFTCTHIFSFIYEYICIHTCLCIDSNISVKSFGFSGKLGSMCELAKQFKETSTIDVYKRNEQIKFARQYYTYSGVMKQLEAFFSDPLGESGGCRLTCVRVPMKDRSTP